MDWGENRALCPDTDVWREIPTAKKGAVTRDAMMLPSWMLASLDESCLSDEPTEFEESPTTQVDIRIVGPPFLVGKGFAEPVFGDIRNAHL